MNNKPSSSPLSILKSYWLHIVYALVCGFFIASGPLLLKNTLNSLSNLVSDESQISQNFDQLTRLRRLIIALNGPGNDVFGNHDPAAEGKKFQQVLGDYKAFMGELRAHGKKTENEEILLNKAFLERVDQRVEALEKITHEILTSFAAGKERDSAKKNGENG